MNKEAIVKRVESNKEHLPASDFIYNRCDKQGRDAFLTYMVKENGNEQYIHAWFQNGEGRIGVWTTNISKKAIKAIAKDMYSQDKKMKRIVVEFCFSKIGYTEFNPHFEVPLPNKMDDLLQRMRGKHLRQVSAMKRKLAAEYGEIKLLEYKASDCPDNIYDFYLKNKKVTKGIDIVMTKDDYFEKYYVSNVYALTFGDTIVSLILSCEQCENAYLENLTYDKSLSKYSPGKLIYIDFLCRMVEKHKKSLYLGGGNYEYKKQFDSIEKETYYCVIPRHGIQVPFLKFKYFLKHLIGRD